MRERRIIKVDGQMLPVLRVHISREYYPEKPQKLTMPPRPKGLSKEEAQRWYDETDREFEKVREAEEKRYLAEREPITKIEIEFMAWTWKGREIGTGHVKTIDGAWLDVHGLHLPDGRVVNGISDDLPNDRICANAAILREERESKVSYVRLHPEDMAEVRAIGKNVALQGEMLDAATNQAVDFHLQFGRLLDLSPKEQTILEALRKKQGDTSKASKMLLILNPKNKRGFSQSSVWNAKDRIAKKYERATGRKAESIFTASAADIYRLDKSGQPYLIGRKEP